MRPHDRAALERLLRYILRPAVVPDRIVRRDDAWVTDGVALCRRLATLIPPRRVHAVVYHGVFASAHRLRARIASAALPDPVVHDPYSAGPRVLSPALRMTWSLLLERVFGDDVTRCPRRGDRLALLASISDPAVTARILTHLGLASERPQLSPARAPPVLFADDA